MPGGVGFYVHHHGRGHANRARQIVAHLSTPVTLFSSNTTYLQTLQSDRIQVIKLPSDVVPLTEEQHNWPDVLHYAPLQVPGIQQRMHIMAGWIARESPALVVVDVSVEVALFARLCSLPVIIMRQHGVRTDAAHLAAFQSCLALIAPFAKCLEEPTVPVWVQQKTFYAGGFSRFSQRVLTQEQARQQLGFSDRCRHIVIISGLGGQGISAQQILDAAAHTPGWMWWAVGPVGDVPSQDTPQIRWVGKVDDPFPYLKAADVVVGSAGNNTVMEVAAARARFVCIPEERPFEEQKSKAEALKRLGVALVLNDWPAAKHWPRLLVDTDKLDTTGWQQVENVEGAKQAADFIANTAEKLLNTNTF